MQMNKLIHILVMTAVFLRRMPLLTFPLIEESGAVMMQKLL